MNARYWQRGETLDYTADELDSAGNTEKAVTNGQVVSLGNRIGVAGNDIAEGATGALHVTGVYIMDKKASEKITMGAPVYYDTAEDEITATEKGNVPAGYAAATAEASDATVLVNIGDPDGAPAVHNSLAMKGEDGKVYDITVATGGTLKATERT